MSLVGRIGEILRDDIGHGCFCGFEGDCVHSCTASSDDGKHVLIVSEMPGEFYVKTIDDRVIEHLVRVKGSDTLYEIGSDFLRIVPVLELLAMEAEDA